MQDSVGRCHNGWRPAFLCQCGGQVTHDIRYAANLATRQGAVFRGNKDDLSGAIHDGSASE